MAAIFAGQPIRLERLPQQVRGGTLPEYQNRSIRSLNNPLNQVDDCRPQKRLRDVSVTLTQSVLQPVRQQVEQRLEQSAADRSPNRSIESVIERVTQSVLEPARETVSEMQPVNQSVSQPAPQNSIEQVSQSVQSELNRQQALQPVVQGVGGTLRQVVRQNLTQRSGGGVNISATQSARLTGVDVGDAQAQAQRGNLPGLQNSTQTAPARSEPNRLGRLPYQPQKVPTREPVQAPRPKLTPKLTEAAKGTQRGGSALGDFVPQKPFDMSAYQKAGQKAGQAVPARVGIGGMGLLPGAGKAGRFAGIGSKFVPLVNIAAELDSFFGSGAEGIDPGTLPPEALNYSEWKRRNKPKLPNQLDPYVPPYGYALLLYARSPNNWRDVRAVDLALAWTFVKERDWQGYNNNHFATIDPPNQMLASKLTLNGEWLGFGYSPCLDGLTIRVVPVQLNYSADKISLPPGDLWIPPEDPLIWEPEAGSPYEFIPPLPPSQPRQWRLKGSPNFASTPAPFRLDQQPVPPKNPKPLPQNKAPEEYWYPPTNNGRFNYYDDFVGKDCGNPECCMECRFDPAAINAVVRTCCREILAEQAKTNATADIEVEVLASCGPAGLVPTFEERTVKVQNLMSDAYTLLMDRVAMIESGQCGIVSQPPSSPELPEELREKLDRVLGNLEASETITLQFEDCDGNVQAIPVTGNRLQVLARAFEALNQFDLRAQQIACESNKLSDRIYRILGGDNWYPDQSAKTPEFNSAVLSAVESWGEQQALGTDAEGKQVKLLNLLDLIAAYSAVPYYKAGLQGFPAEMPASLLSYSDQDPPVKIRDLSSYLGWFIKQFDALVGQFPIEIEFEDIDPATKGNQTKKVELCNLSEALTELFGTSFKSSINSDLAINFLMRLSSEVIATKNATLIGQEYSRANAAFLGYRGNAAIREVNYSFSPGNLDSLDEFLQESKGQYTGWAEDDPESVVGYLQKIVFSAGIIKAAFFKSPRDITKLQRELENLTEGDEQKSDADWLKLLALLNNQDSFFNRNAPKPNIDNQRGQS
jgi:hypothetical protein